MASFPVLESVERYLPEDEKGLWPPKENGTFLHHTPIFNTSDCFARLQQGAGYFVDRSKTNMKQFIAGSQLCQVVALRHQLELARRRWPDCTGALFYKLNDNYPAASWATADWCGAPKIAHWFVQDSFAPLGVYVNFRNLNSFGSFIFGWTCLIDDADALAGTQWAARVRMVDGDLRQVRDWTFTGEGSTGAVKMLGALKVPFEETEAVPLFFVTELEVDGRQAFRTFYFLNYEMRRGCLFELPRTNLKMTARGKQVAVANTGRLPAVGACVERPGHADTFRASENWFWLDAGEKRTVEVSETEGLAVSALNA
jgi:beta-mannosidase